MLSRIPMVVSQPKSEGLEEHKYDAFWLRMILPSILSSFLLRNTRRPSGERLRRQDIVTMATVTRIGLAFEKNCANLPKQCKTQSKHDTIYMVE